MRRKITLLCALAALACSLTLPAVSNAQTPGPASTASAVANGVGLPLQSPPSLAYVPAGFSSDGQQAIDAAKATRTMQELHATHHPLQIDVQIWAASRWEVDFYFRYKLLAEADVAPNGHVTAVWVGSLAAYPAGRGHFGGLFDSPWVVLSFAVLFLLPFFDWRRPLRLAHLDLLVLLSFGVSYWRFNNAHFGSAVLLVYPPLLYLLGRMLVVGLRRRGPRAGISTRMPLIVLAGGLVALVGARIGLDLAGDKVIDVGYASVIGAHRLAHGMPLYYASAAHPDTYGPVTYLAYVPFERLWPWSGGWDHLAAAHAAAITFDLLTIVGMVALGLRLRGRRTGLRLGLTLGWLWAAFPFTLFGLMNNTNDGLVAMLFVYVLLALASPLARGALVGLATASKFFPLVLLPLAVRGVNATSEARRSRRAVLVCVVGFAATVIATTLPFLPGGGVRELYNHTIGFQLGRNDLFSLWGLHPSLSWLKLCVLVAALLLAVAVAVAPAARRSAAQIAALSAAVVIAIQLPAEHWFYFYIVWFAPLVLVAIAAGETGSHGHAAPDERSSEADTPRDDELLSREPVAAAL